MATAPTPPLQAVMQWLSAHRGMVVPLGIVASIMVLVVPISPVLMDLLLSFNLALSVIILLSTLYIRSPLELSVFPSLLLGTTLMRLVLNVATTRLILTRAGEAGVGVDAAGGVIRAFGEFVAGDKIVVGLIIFIILVAIQFVVITKGTTRIAEVAARFTLDGMPGRQMAVDADLNAGLIDETQARQRREEILREADFYGAMDGASKFVRGDAVAGIIITLINIVGGLYIGTVESGMSFGEAGAVFTKLTIGDGLVSQIPAFIIALAAGLIVTRSTAKSNLGNEVLSQIGKQPEALAIAAGFMGLLAFTSLPRIPLLLLGASCGGVAFLVRRGQVREAKTAVDVAERRRVAEKKPARPEGELRIDPMELEVGYALVRLVDRSKGGDLLDRITAIRQQTAQTLGVMLPPIRIRDNVELEPNTYRIKIKGVPVATGPAYADQFLAMNSGMATAPLQGIETIEPAFGLKATWVGPEQRERAEALGYTVVDAVSVVATHLTEIIRRHADELLSREQVKRLLDQLKEASPTVVEEVVPEQIKMGQLQHVLQNLLRERVSVRDMETILETLGDFASRTQDLDILTEYVRHRLSRSICQQYRDGDGALYVVTLDPAVEDRIAGCVEHSERGSLLSMPPAVSEKIVAAVRIEAEKLSTGGRSAVVLCSPQVRMHLKRMTEAALPTLAVLSYNEIPRDVNVESVGMVTDS